jgi:HNH endonuclease
MLRDVEWVDKETMTAELAAAQCSRCSHIGGRMTVVLGESGPHFARVDCKACGRFIDWVSYPVAAPKRTRRRSRKRLRDLGDHCEICLRHRDDLPSSQELQVHHVEEVVADNGGDEDSNLRVYCSACHALVNWARTYFGHYHAVAAVTGTDWPDDVPKWPDAAE